MIFYFITLLLLFQNYEACVQYYTVVNGDYCYKIATDFGLTLDKFLSMNPSLNCNMIYKGQVVCVADKTVKTCDLSYRVQSGDTCIGIASKFGTTLDKFLQLNPGINCTNLQIQQIVCIPIAQTTTTVTTTLATTTILNSITCGLYHIVSSGDYCHKIAVSYGITLETLISFNPNINCNIIYSGQYICVALQNTIVQIGSTTPATTTATTTTITTPLSTTTLSSITQSVLQNNVTCNLYHIVQTGDYCQKIAVDYGITLEYLISINPKINCTIIYKNQIICVSDSTVTQTPTTTTITTTTTTATTKQTTISTTSTISASQTSTQNVVICKGYHIVSKGEFCYQIAMDYQLTLTKLISMNPDVDCSIIHEGNLICIADATMSYVPTKTTTLSTTVSTTSPATKTSTTTIPQNIENVKNGTIDILPDYWISKEEFERAIMACGYPKPADGKYENFITLAEPDGGITTKRELAMFLTQIMWESGGLRYVEETACIYNGCPEFYGTKDDYPGVDYHGRGYIQLSWCYNYKAASLALFNDLRLYTNPDLVADDDSISWGVSFWYWKEKVHSLPGIAEGYFGVSTDAINGFLECRGDYQYKAKQRFELYKIVLSEFGINEEAIEDGCYPV